jgi:hypothetical protein
LWFFDDQAGVCRLGVGRNMATMIVVIAAIRARITASVIMACGPWA